MPKTTIVAEFGETESLQETQMPQQAHSENLDEELDPSVQLTLDKESHIEYDVELDDDLTDDNLSDFEATSENVNDDIDDFDEEPVAQVNESDTVDAINHSIDPSLKTEDIFIDKLVRAIIAISLFEAAYVAEVIRGGLQALPRGQYEAAKSLGMGYWRMHIFVILPQALKLVIPGIANTFLALVKDTPLIFVVGLLEIVGMLNLAKTNPEWLGFAMEGYVFAAIIFWIICYAMSKYSYNLEQKYKTDR